MTHQLQISSKQHVVKLACLTRMLQKIIIIIMEMIIKRTEYLIKSNSTKPQLYPLSDLWI